MKYRMFFFLSGLSFSRVSFGVLASSGIMSCKKINRFLIELQHAIQITLPLDLNIKDPLIAIILSQGLFNCPMRIIVILFLLLHGNEITPLIFKLHWLPIKFRIEFKILLTTFKILQFFRTFLFILSRFS